MINWWPARRAIAAGRTTADSDTVGAAYPSLDVIRAELDVEVTSVERRASVIDTRAGQLLGFAGVLVGLTAKDISSWTQAAGLGCAVVAALIAISVLFPRTGKSVNPQALREIYLRTPSESTKLAVLDARISFHQKDEKDLQRKRTQFFAATIPLALAILLSALGPIIHVAKAGQHGRGSPNGGGHQHVNPSPHLVRTQHESIP